MYLTRREVLELDEASLLAFVERRIDEGHHLDYKAALSGGGPGLPDKAKWEFLKDVSSFANANGGVLLIGVKEPASGLASGDQIAGVDAGDALAKSLERLAADMVKPRIVGLLVRPIPLAGGRWVVVVFVPPSAGKPHQFVLEGRLGLYMRHTESSFPMTEFELRETVVSALGAEARAGNYLEKQQTRILNEFWPGQSRLLLQAVPLVPPEQPLDVLTAPLRAALQFDDRTEAPHELASLQSMIKPVAMLEGVFGLPERQNPGWRSEVHRNGYVGVVFRIAPWDFGGGRGTHVTIGPDTKDVLVLFGSLFRRVLTALEFESPYLVRACFHNARALKLHAHPKGSGISEPLGREVLPLPDRVCPTKEQYDQVLAEWWTVVHNAYGVDRPFS